MRSLTLLALAMALSLGAQGCANSSTPIDVAPIEATVSPPTPGDVPSPVPDTAVPSPPSSASSPARVPSDCAPGAGLELAALDPELRRPLEAALAYLGSGEDPSHLEAFLDSQGLLPRFNGDEGTYSGSVTARWSDLTGDGAEEPIVSILAPMNSLAATAGLFVTFACPDGSTATHGFITPDCVGECGYDFIAEDVAALGYPQLLVLNKGAPEGSTCQYTQVLLTAPRPDGWEVLLDTGPIEFDSACTVTLEADTPRARHGIVLEGYRTGGGGSLPSRMILEAYSWDEAQFGYALSRREYLPSAYRIHVLEDAQHAIDRGQIGKALALYRIAMFDTLIDYPSNAEQGITPGVYAYEDDLPPTPFAYQTSFAKFRSVVLLEALGNHDAAQQYLRYMLPPGEPGGEFKEMATLFLSSLEQGGLWLDACQAAAREIADKYPLLLGYDGHIGYWGPTTVSYDVSTVCPSIPDD